jgi:hypothetical protein
MQRESEEIYPPLVLTHHMTAYSKIAMVGHSGLMDGIE